MTVLCMRWGDLLANLGWLLLVVMDLAVARGNEREREVNVY